MYQNKQGIFLYRLKECCGATANESAHQISNAVNLCRGSTQAVENPRRIKLVPVFYVR